MTDILIAGGGIGGLAAALAVADSGHHAIVLERADRFTEFGAGIQLAPNGINALEALGVGTAARNTTVHMDELRFMDGVTGDHVTSLDLGHGYQSRFAGPYVVAHRAELHGVLLEACRASPAVSLVSSAAVEGYEQGDSVVVRLTDGRRYRGAALIGADGIRSAVRGQLLADGAPRVSGINVYRSLIPVEDVPEDLRQDRSVVWWTGPGCHFVHYPIAGGSHLNLAASSDERVLEPVTAVPVGHNRVRREFRELGRTAQRLLDLGRDWKCWTLVDRDPTDTWTEGRVALLGDAAHPMLHYAAQGACQALEDAVTLGRLLRGAEVASLPSLLSAYAQARRERTSRVQLVSRESIRLWHAQGRGAQERNTVLAALSQRELQDYVAWMHGFRVTEQSGTVTTG